MDEQPRDNLWWVPWHWSRRLWIAVILIGGPLTLAGSLMLILMLGLLYWGVRQ